MAFPPLRPGELNLDLTTGARELTPEELADRPPATVPQLKRLRDSHHTLARLIAAGLTTEQASLQTGYSYNRIALLRNDPSFANLVAFYRASRDEARLDLEARYLLIANDYAQHIHEQVLDAPEEVPLAQALEVFKAMADRGGMSPTAKSISKNINLNIGDRLDAARRRTTIVDGEPVARNTHRPHIAIPKGSPSPWERGDG